MDRLLINPEFENWWRKIGVNSVAAAVAKFLPDDRHLQKVTVQRVSCESGQQCIELFFKLYDSRKDRWRFWLRPSKARTEFENYLTFHRIGVPAAKPIACGEERDALGRLGRAFMVTQAVPNARQLDEFMRHTVRREQRQSVIHQLADIVRRLHSANFFYHDLVWRNILVSESEGGLAQIFLIDCPRGGVSRFGKRRKLLRDLASLDKLASQLCPSGERLRFLLLYLGKKKLDDEARGLARACLGYRRTRWPEDWRGK